jgi:hypothetical protein
MAGRFAMGGGAMGFEPEDVDSDPFVDWVRDTIVCCGTTEAGDGGDLAELRALATEVDHEISSLAASDVKVSSRTFVHVNKIDPQWLTAWLTFDPDSGADTGEDPLQRTDPNTALIDNTTVNLVASYIENKTLPSPLGLLDLANFVNNLVLRDQLVAMHFPLGSGSKDLRIRDAIRSPGPVQAAILGSALLRIRQLAHADINTLPESAEAAATWSIILGTDAPSPEAMFDVPFRDALKYLNAVSLRIGGRTFSKNTSLGSTTLINQLFEPAWSWSGQEKEAAVQATNCRSLLNLEAARYYNIPYAGGITRLPIKRLLWRRGRQGDAMLAAIDKSDLGVVNTLDRAYRQRVAATLDSNQETVVLPVFLAAVLSRIDHLDQFSECAYELREQARPLRRRLVTIEQALNSTQPQHEIRSLLSAFGDDSRLLRRTLGDLVPVASAVAGVVLAAATGQPQWLTAVLAALGARDSLRGQTWERLYNRVRRRDLWFVTELGQVSSELVAAIPKLELLWKRRFDHANFSARLNKLQELKTL